MAEAAAEAAAAEEEEEKEEAVLSMTRASIGWRGPQAGPDAAPCMLLRRFDLADVKSSSSSSASSASSAPLSSCSEKPSGVQVVDDEDDDDEEEDGDDDDDDDNEAGENAAEWPGGGSGEVSDDSRCEVSDGSGEVSDGPGKACWEGGRRAEGRAELGERAEDSSCRESLFRPSTAGGSGFLSSRV